MFIWMPKEHLYVLVYLVTVMHSMQGGYMDKAQKYTDKAFTQIEKLKSESSSNLHFLMHIQIIQPLHSFKLELALLVISLTT
jgi:MAternally affected uncoordination